MLRPTVQAMIPTSGPAQVPWSCLPVYPEAHHPLALAALAVARVVWAGLTVAAWLGLAIAKTAEPVRVTAVLAGGPVSAGVPALAVWSGDGLAWSS